jgi:Cu/Ag efflux pump CusA
VAHRVRVYHRAGGVVALESDQHSPLDVPTVADNVLRRRLLAVPGVSQVIATGGGQKQYQVLVDAVELREYKVHFHESGCYIKVRSVCPGSESAP